MDTAMCVSSWAFLPDKQEKQTYLVSEFQSEFFSFVYGASLNYGYIAAKVAADTTIWGYQEIRRRQCYWLDKKKLMERIIRTTNISLWQKHKDKLYQKGLWVDGVCCILGEKTAWIGLFGEASVVEIRKSGEERSMGTINEDGENSRKKLGADRYSIDIQIASFPFEQGDTFLFAIGKSASYSNELLHLLFQEKEINKEGDGVFFLKHI